ncbi:unnamed protein product [Arctogadus glacialis]
MYETGTRHDYDRTVACTASMGPTTALPEESMGGPQLWDCHKEGGWLDRMKPHDHTGPDFCDRASKWWTRSYRPSFIMPLVIVAR